MAPRPRTLAASALLALGVAWPASCGSPSVPKSAATISGPIVALGSRTPTSGDLPTVHVKSSATDPCGIIFALTRATKILRRNAGGGLVKIGYEDLAVGQTVNAWADGAVAESCPAQARATTIEVLPGPPP